MSRTPSPKIAERNAKIVTEYQTEELTVKTLSDKYGISPQAIRLVLKRAGAQATRKAGAPHGSQHPNSVYERKPVSQLHVKAGYRFNDHLWRITMDRVSDLAVDLGISELVLVHFRLGMGDPTLSQLQKIATYMGIPVHELLDPTYDIRAPVKRSDDN